MKKTNIVLQYPSLLYRKGVNPVWSDEPRILRLITIGYSLFWL